MLFAIVNQLATKTIYSSCNSLLESAVQTGGSTITPKGSIIESEKSA
jgi:hypothetical protein